MVGLLGWQFDTSGHVYSYYSNVMANKAQRHMFILVEKVYIPRLRVLLIYLGCGRNFMGTKQTIFC